MLIIFPELSTLSDAIPQFISEMDKMLFEAGFAWGEQWRNIEQEYEAPIVGGDLF